MSSDDFLAQIRSCVDGAASTKKLEPTKEANVTFNMRINEGLRNDFDELCKENHTNMSREIKRYMRLAIANQEL